MNCHGCKWLDRYKKDGNGYCCKVERKMSWTEICGNFFQHRDRFVREFERAKAAGFKVYLLIEGESWESAYAGRYRSKVLPQCLVASLTAWMARYNCVVIFCTARTAPKLIKEVLYREAKENFTEYFREDNNVDDGCR